MTGRLPSLGHSARSQTFPFASFSTMSPLSSRLVGWHGIYGENIRFGRKCGMSSPLLTNLQEFSRQSAKETARDPFSPYPPLAFRCDSSPAYRYIRSPVSERPFQALVSCQTVRRRCIHLFPVPYQGPKGHLYLSVHRRASCYTCTRRCFPGLPTHYFYDCPSGLCAEYLGALL